MPIINSLIPFCLKSSYISNKRENLIVHSEYLLFHKTVILHTLFLWITSLIKSKRTATLQTSLQGNLSPDQQLFEAGIHTLGMWTKIFSLLPVTPIKWEGLAKGLLIRPRDLSKTVHKIRTVFHAQLNLIQQT